MVMLSTVRRMGRSGPAHRPASPARVLPLPTLLRMRLAVCSSKGGVGKTTTAANLAAALARRGRVLAVDVDPQDSLGRAFGVVAKRPDESLAALLDDPDAEARAVIRRDVVPGLDLLPAHPARCARHQHGACVPSRHRRGARGGLHRGTTGRAGLRRTQCGPVAGGADGWAGAPRAGMGPIASGRVRR